MAFEPITFGCGNIASYMNLLCWLSIIVIQYIPYVVRGNILYGIAGSLEPYPPGYNSLLSFNEENGRWDTIIPSMSITMLTNPDLACYDSKHNYYYYLYSNETATVPVGIWIYDLTLNKSILPSIDLSNYVQGFIGIPIGATNAIICDNKYSYIYVLGVSNTNNTNQQLYRIDTDNNFKIQLISTYLSLNDPKYKINFYNPGIHLFDTTRNRIWFTLYQSKEGYKNIYNYFNVDLTQNGNNSIIKTVESNDKLCDIAYYYQPLAAIIGLNVTENHSLDLLFFDPVTLKINNAINGILRGQICFLQFEGTIDKSNEIWYGQIFTFPNNDTGQPCNIGYLIGIDLNNGNVVNNTQMCDLGPGIGNCVTNMIYI